ncbi:hypothetical protein FIA58_001445 [Flavobacterium jejuense]|uniref:Type II secretion system protein GspG C-terminal domain-containing protein n=1 Tax=Flavobacterium jejuense TaxID=1544455 RepID=A0ABX0IMR6_9FLAO|nr:hypothetical protein [Flavobacterium jejuense]NHN24325.1 hypothetical protein [Flavobacterium jejuense]
MKKKKATAKENKLLPSTKIFITILCITFLFSFGFATYKNYFGDDKKVQEELSKVIALLDKEKESMGFYPKELTEIIRNNPLHKNITIDLWGNAYHYKSINNGSTYILLSKGRDGILNTDDDIIK